MVYSLSWPQSSFGGSEKGRRNIGPLFDVLSKRDSDTLECIYESVADSLMSWLLGLLPASPVGIISPSTPMTRSLSSPHACVVRLFYPLRLRSAKAVNDVY